MQETLNVCLSVDNVVAKSRGSNTSALSQWYPMAAGVFYQFGTEANVPMVAFIVDVLMLFLFLKLIRV
jgi:hypothetical protein